METAISTLSILPSGKQQVQKFKNQLKGEILSNTKNPLPMLVHLKWIEKTISDILKDEEIDYHWLKEFLLYSKDEKVVVEGVELRSSETGVKYDYAACGDPQWFDLMKQQEELTKKIKEREEFLRNIPYDKGTVDPDTGVFITRAPKKSHTKVIVKL